MAGARALGHLLLPSHEHLQGAGAEAEHLGPELALWSAMPEVQVVAYGPPCYNANVTIWFLFSSESLKILLLSLES